MKHLELKPFLIKEFGDEWYELLQKHLHSDYFYDLGVILRQEQAKFTIYPAKENIFRAFRLTPFSKLKGVILGQDPYHDGSADGLCFSNSLTKEKPSPSLCNIMKEMYEDIEEPSLNYDLQHWAEQGLLMLNTALTVRQGDANSHERLWSIFSSTLVQEISFNKNDVVWMMWGKQAQRYKQMIDNKTHSFICTSHPSPLGAYHGETPFIGSRCFSKFNNALWEKKISPIIW